MADTAASRQDPGHEVEGRILLRSFAAFRCIRPTYGSD